MFYGGKHIVGKPCIPSILEISITSVLTVNKLKLTIKDVLFDTLTWSWNKGANSDHNKWTHQAHKNFIPSCTLPHYGRFVRVYFISYCPFYISSLNLCSFLSSNCYILQKE